MTPIKMPDDKITSPDSICLLGDGVLAISQFQDNTGPLLYDWTSDDLNETQNLNVLTLRLGKKSDFFILIF